MNLMGIDMGTTSVKTAVFDEALNEKMKLTADYTLESKGDRVEFEAEKYWDIFKKVLSSLNSENDIDALAIDTQCETLILTDEDGNPVRNAIVWLDNRATREAQLIEERFGRQKPLFPC